MGLHYPPPKLSRTSRGTHEFRVLDTTSLTRPDIVLWGLGGVGAPFRG